MEQFGQNIAQFLLNHPHFGGIITFSIAFAESLAIIGTIIPGSVTMTAIGLLVGTGIMPLGSTLFWAVLGAFIGDLLGYWVGVYYNEGLRNMWPFRRHPGWLEAGERFFQKHGGKSIIIGRFIGPVRSLIPLVAGLLHMSWQRFILAAIPAATLWALAYMLPGIFIGALSLQLPPGTATRFILFFFLIIVILTIIGWTFKNVFHHLRLQTDRFIKKLWLSLRAQKKYHWFVHLIENKQNPEQHQQLGLAIFALISLLFFILVFISLKSHSMLALLNYPTFELLRSLRHVEGDKAMIAFTALGDGRVLIPAGIIILLWLCWKKDWHTAAHWFFIIAVAAIIPSILKFVVHSPRPIGILHSPNNNSFPSGHTIVSVLYFGFLATLFSTHLKNSWKTFPYYIASFIVALVALSRLYLGVHWMTDILGSISLGLFFITTIVISYRRDPDPKMSLRYTGIVIIAATLLSWLIYLIPHYKQMLDNYTPVWPMTIITLDDWWDNTNEAIPLYRMNRLGKLAEPLNIQWLGQIKSIEEALTAQGWKKYSVKNDLTFMIEKVSGNTKKNPVSQFAIYYNNKLPSLILTKRAIKNHNTLVLRLWRSQVNFLDADSPHLYLGILACYEQHRAKRKKEFISHNNLLNNFIQDLKNFQWLELTIPSQKRSELAGIIWDGKILQVR